MKTCEEVPLRLTAWAGMAAPVLFVGTFVLEGFFRPAYDSFSFPVSALSLGARGFIQIANFMVFGSLLFVFTRGAAWVGFSTRSTSRAGVIILTIIGAGYFLSGPFVMDPVGTTRSAATFHGDVHNGLGALVFLLMPIACFLFLGRFRAASQTRYLCNWTLVLGVVTTVADLLFIIASTSPAFGALAGRWFGLMQRSVIVPFMTWLFVFALHVKGRLART